MSEIYTMTIFNPKVTLPLGLLLLAATGGLFAQQPDFPIGLRQGVMAGEVTADSAILQSRLTSTSTREDPRWSVVTGARGVAQFEISTQADFSGSVKTTWMEARPENDFIVKRKISGLQLGTRHYFRLHYGPDENNRRRSETATFRTNTGPAADAPFSFAVVTGMAYSKFHYTGGSPDAPPYSGPDKHLGYPALEAIVRAGADYFVGTGDNVYYDTPRVGRAETLHQMRAKHQEQYSQPRFLKLFSKVASYWMKDDHDHRFDDSDAVNPMIAFPELLVAGPKPYEYYPKRNIHPNVSGSGFLPSHELGIRVFREQMPVVDPSDPDAVTYRTHRISKSLQIWFVEGRDYRSPNDMPDGPQKTIWGSKQKQWLKRTLLESDATFKILFSATPMVGPDSTSKRDNHVNPRGFRHEGDAFFEWLEENGFLRKNFYIVCGDRHWQYHAIHPSGFEEFSSGALVDANAIPGTRPGDPGSSDPEAKIKHPYHYDEPTGGFLLVKFDPGDSAPKLEFRFYDEKGKMLYSTTKTTAH